MKIAVLGCGPAALIAAHAVYSLDHEPVIYSKKTKSPMPGAQYLHEPIPGITPPEPDGMITVVKEGSKEGYAKKVYGDENHPVSWESYEHGTEQPAWKLSKTYNLLWDKWANEIIDFDIEPQDVFYFARHYDLVLSSVPLNRLCRSGHTFDGQRVWISKHAWPGIDGHNNIIVYNGLEPCGNCGEYHPEMGWYRTSRLFGHPSTEWSFPVMASWTGVKPTTTNCTCLPSNFRPIGRFGRWKKNTLVHHAYQEAISAVLGV